MEHKCDRSWCRNVGFYGSAIGTIEFLDDSTQGNLQEVWVAHNDEYGTEIRYCPFCGAKL